MHVAFAGGVGGARLAVGLAAVLAPEELLIVVNTGDDFTHLGLRICPDIDTVMYTLAGIANPETGWGIRGDTWTFMDGIAAQGGETWFRIGDRDLETHRMRTAALAAGRPLSAATAELAARLGIGHRIVPASDDEVATIVVTATGRIPFQEYFVHRQCRPEVTGFEFAGAVAASASPAVAAAFATDRVRSVIFCPSNPFVSIAPILAVPAIRRCLEQGSFPVVAVSPIVGGRALKGPAAKMMRELGLPPTASAVAGHYRGLVDAMVIDEADHGEADGIRRLGQEVLVTGTVMRSAADRRRLALEVIAFAEGLRR